MRAISRSTLVRSLALVLFVGLILLLVSEGISDYRLEQLSYGGYYFAVLAGLTVLAGQSGQISLGHGGLMAVGAYTVALLIGNEGWSLFPALVAATVVSLVVGVPVGAAASRLRALQPDPQRRRALVARGPRRRDRRLAVRSSRRTHADARVRDQRRLRRTGRRAVRGGLPARVTRGVHAPALALPAGRPSSSAGSGRWPARRGERRCSCSCRTWTNDIASSFSLSTNVSHNLPLAVYGAILIGAMLLWPSGIQGAVRALARVIGTRIGPAPIARLRSASGAGSRPR